MEVTRRLDKRTVLSDAVTVPPVSQLAVPMSMIGSHSYSRFRFVHCCILSLISSFPCSPRPRDSSHVCQCGESSYSKVAITRARGVGRSGNEARTVRSGTPAKIRHRGCNRMQPIVGPSSIEQEAWRNSCPAASWHPENANRINPRCPYSSLCPDMWILRDAIKCRLRQCHRSSLRIDRAMVSAATQINECKKLSYQSRVSRLERVRPNQSTICRLGQVWEVQRQRRRVQSLP